MTIIQVRQRNAAIILRERSVVNNVESSSRATEDRADADSQNGSDFKMHFDFRNSFTSFNNLQVLNFTNGKCSIGTAAFYTESWNKIRQERERENNEL